jgi:hypothetical protein
MAADHPDLLLLYRSGVFESVLVAAEELLEEAPDGMEYIGWR